jgi:methionyl-tRNA synthetase
MNSQEKFYITTTLPYVNSKPHMGHAQEFVYADVIARYQRDVLGKEVVFNTGTDEHGQKIYEKALEEKKDPQAYTDEYAAKFDGLKQMLNLSYDHFIRTTDPHHIQAAQEFWKLCDQHGDIYKKNYKVKYCVGCELEKTESDLDESGHCLIHPHLEIETIDEENYFFRFSKYEQPLLEFYEKHPDFVVPDFRFNEIKQFVKSGLQDFSISRLSKKMPWGVPVPGDGDHVMYVWFDALINYISTLGWPDKLIEYNEFWPGIQIAGKDNLRQQSAMWQAMLMSAGLPNSKQIIIHGFINSGGQKMSKSLGNVIDPMEIVEKYGTDALRYWLCREVSTFEDGDFTWEKFKESYNSGLANGIGNQVSRILKLAITYNISLPEGLADSDFRMDEMNAYRIKDSMDSIWHSIALCDQDIQKSEPFKKIKDPSTEEDARKDIMRSLIHIRAVANRLKPFLPETSEKILAVLKDPKLENIPRLFPRVE